MAFYNLGGESNMRKMLSILVVSILVIGVFGAVANLNEMPNETESITISTPIVTDSNEFVKIDFEESSSILLDPGKPEIPIVKRTYTFPFGTKINSVYIDFSGTDKPAVLRREGYIYLLLPMKI